MTTATETLQPWYRIWELTFTEFDGPKRFRLGEEVTRALDLVPGSRYRADGDYGGLTEEQAQIIQDAEARQRATEREEGEAYSFAKQQAIKAGDEKTGRLIEQGWPLNPHRVHYLAVRRAAEQGKPIPPKVLRDYAGESWADTN